MPLTCRFYANKFPEVDDVVMVNVRSIAEMGAYVTLLEYNNIEGMILLSELSRRRIRSINKLIRVGRNECVVVLRVDKEKGYIDLSKRRVSPEEAKKCEEKFNKAKQVNGILRHVAEVSKMDFEELYTKTAWALEKEMGGPAKSYDAFKLAITDKPDVFDNLEITEEVKKCLLANVERRLTPQPIKIRADVEVACYAYEGIDAIKAALRAGIAKSTEALPIKITLIAPPLYVVTTVSLDKDAGVAKLTEALDEIQRVITEKQGSMKIKMEPRAVSDLEDHELAQMMQQYEQENAEVGSGSEDEEEAASAADA